MRHAMLLVLIAGSFGIWSPTPAQAQLLNHSWIASNGVDNGSCGDRAAPCASFGGALSRTVAGGEITCLDASYYGNVVVTKSITINCESALASNSNANIVLLPGLNVFTAASDIVIVRGVDLDGAGSNI